MKEPSKQNIASWSRTLGVAICACVIGAIGCGDDDTGGPSGPCEVGSKSTCAGSDVCEAVEGAEPACFAPIVVRGAVLDLLDQDPIGEAIVVAVDEAGVGDSRRVISAGDGSFQVTVPAPRDAAGNPLPKKVTLFAQAAGYATFPDAPRRSPQIEISAAAGDPPVIENADTRIQLQRDALEPTETAGEIEGRIEGELGRGALVTSGGKIAMADREGRFVLFDVPGGENKVEVYRRGGSFELAVADVPNRARLYDFVVRQTSAVAATLSGSFTFEGGATSSDVALALADTYDATSGRGVVPPSLRYTNLGATFTLEGIPRGKYVVLTALGDDGFVVDPTFGPPTITVAGDAALAPLRIVPAVELLAPASAVTPIVGTPTFSWKDTMIEDAYRVEVIEPRRGIFWSDEVMPVPNAEGVVSFVYPGPQLSRGVVYQVRLTALSGATPITTSEAIRGGFFLPAQ